VISHLKDCPLGCVSSCTPHHLVTLCKEWKNVQTWNFRLQAGRDALAKAPTGSGKTLAYLAAIIHDLQAQEPHLSRAEGTYAIIMAPTRELCIQICDVLTLILRRFIWLVSIA